MKLASWNVNGIRAVCAKQEWVEWFETTSADMIALQETKAEADQIPAESRNPAGWDSYWLPSTVKKGYSGTGLFVRRSCAAAAPVRIEYEMPAEFGHFGGEGRLIHAELAAFHLLNVYFPNGTGGEDRLEYKLGYYEAFLRYAETLRRDKPVVVCGDFNTAHKPIDLARPKENEGYSGFLPTERAFLDRMTAAGYADTFRLIHGDMPGMYSWWSYKFNARANNVGWRIDYFFVSEELSAKVIDAWIEPDVRGSDHCPVGVELAVD